MLWCLQAQGAFLVTQLEAVTESLSHPGLCIVPPKALSFLSPTKYLCPAYV